MPHDLGTWGFFIALAALLLAYPLDVLAHLTSPKIRDWGAARSIASLQKRRDVLSTQCNQLRNVPVVDEGIDIVLRSLGRMNIVIGQAVNFVLGAIGITQLNAEQLWTWSPNEKVWIIMVIMASNACLIISVNRQLRRYRRRVSPSIRKNITDELTMIEQKLHMRLQQTVS